MLKHNVNLVCATTIGISTGGYFEADGIPFDVAIIPSLQKKDKANYIKAEKIYKFLRNNNIDVLLDDTEENLSAKFKKFDLIGIPYQIIIGSKSTDDQIEFKEINGKTETLSLEEIKNKLLNKQSSN